MHRRKLLQAGLIASTTGLTGASTLLNPVYASTSFNKALTIDHFIYDERFADSLNAAAFFKQTNAIKHKVSGDITNLWYQYLDSAWKHSSITVAGITTESALFYLQRLAWIHQVRLIFHGYHPVPINGDVLHTFKGSERLVASITQMNKQSWPSSLGMALTNCDTSLSALDPIKISLNLPEPKQSKLKPRDTILVSWILAPLRSIT